MDAVHVHCRIDSSEKAFGQRSKQHLVHCRIGSSEKLKAGAIKPSEAQKMNARFWQGGGVFTAA